MNNSNLPIEDNYGDNDIPPVDLPQKNTEKDTYKFIKKTR